MGVIPPTTRITAKIHSIGVVKDFGVIPPKNFFRPRIKSMSVGGDLAGASELFYQINYK